MLKRIFQLFLVLTGILVLAGIGLMGYGFYEANELDTREPMSGLIVQAQNAPDYVQSYEIPDFLKEATVAVEDDQFYNHPGVDPISLFRGILSQLLPFLPSSGGSTITQQVVKNLYQQYNGGWNWKLTEIALAFRLENLLDKDEILTLYVNIINYGDNFIGIDQAAEGYFAVSPIELDEAECSILAGIPQSPANLQLSNRSSFAKVKQKVVLQAMLRNGMITQSQLDAIYETPIAYLAYGSWQILSGSQGNLPAPEELDSLLAS